MCNEKQTIAINELDYATEIPEGYDLVIFPPSKEEKPMRLSLEVLIKSISEKVGRL